ncbi:urease accessory protein UreE [Actibacterium sp. 188UL27-1]|nr:urease accessory protein UreE [Actibacterium sp. 188UL27-1]
MSPPTHRASQHLPGGARAGDPVLSLTYEARLVRRRRFVLESGDVVILDLPTTVSLNAGDALVLEDGGQVAIAAADEPVLHVTGSNLPRLAWHIGNRHTPCQISEGHLIIRQDNVLADMLAGLGATVTVATGPFTPEGGAYGHGRTMGHDHHS